MAKPKRVNGTAGNDVLVGLLDEMNIVYGGNGNDRITGGTLGDVLVGEAGQDTVAGGGGGDGMWGGGGRDRLDGGGGNDNIRGDGGNDVLDGGLGADTMAGGSENDTYYVDDAADVIIETAGGGIDTVYATVAYELPAYVENLTLIGATSFASMGNALDNIINGSGGDDVVDGAAGNDRLNGNGGNDRLQGGHGKDKAWGGEGRDTLDGGAGNDNVNGGAREDDVSGGANNDFVFGGGGNDILYGNSGSDRLCGDGGNDTIYGGTGNDVLTGGQIDGKGQKGIDTFAWQRDDIVDSNGTAVGFDRITDLAQGDRLDLSDVFADTHPDLASVLQVRDTTRGTVISADIGSGHFVDVVLLSGIHTSSLDSLLGKYDIIV